jgi:HD superfamily phosphohydrolase
MNDAMQAGSFPMEITDVLCLMENSEAEPSNTFKNHSINIAAVLFKPPSNPISPENATTAIRTFLSNLISGELDVDKMDYLLRDSHFTGVSYGHYNADHLIINTLTKSSTLKN